MPNMIGEDRIHRIFKPVVISVTLYLKGTNIGFS